MLAFGQVFFPLRENVTPNFKVRVGDFRTELEAIRLQRDLEYQYPGGFIVRDDIKFPKLDIEHEKEMEEELDGSEEGSDTEGDEQK